MTPYEMVPKLKVEMLGHDRDDADVDVEVASIDNDVAFEKLMRVASEMEAAKSAAKAQPSSLASTRKHQFECYLCDVAEEFAKSRRKLRRAMARLKRVEKELDKAKEELAASSPAVIKGVFQTPTK